MLFLNVCLFKKVTIMTKIKLLLLIITLTVFSFFKSNAQNNAIGVRFSDDFSFTYKKKIKGTTCGEFLLSVHKNSIAVTGLYEKYQQTPFSKYFTWYYGGGAFIGIWSDDNNSHAFGGIRGVLGLNYHFTDIPFEISLDWMPTLTLFNDYDPNFVLFGLSLRYTF